MTNHQPAILQPVPAHARHLLFDRRAGADPRGALGALRALADGESVLVGIGDTLVRALGARIAGLRTFPSFAGSPEPIPCTPADLWIWLRADDRGDLYHASRAIEAALCDAFEPIEVIDVFRHADSRDLSGYEDGTENPKDERAVEVAIVAGQGEGLDGGSFVSAQRWIHDLARFERMSPTECDSAIGRRLKDNEEIADAPTYAHVKRSAQESFDPPAFMLRRSMPYGGVAEHGLYFIAFGATVDPFERVLRRMAGLEDGITDGLLRFSRAVSGGHYWCPPVTETGLDLRAIGL